MPVPSTEQFAEIANDFYALWNFPHCCGAIDGKHVRIRNPEKGGSNYFNYKKFFSIVLQALVDANYKYICIDVGNYGKAADEGTFRNSSLYHCLTSGRLKLPEVKSVPEGDCTLPYVIIADNAYPLTPYILKPFSHKTSNPREHNYNKRICRARRTVEHAFSIDRAKWTILGKCIDTDVNTAVHVVKCICILHNIIIDKEGMNHQLMDVRKIPTPSSTQSRSGGRPLVISKRVREMFVEYFYRHRVQKINTLVRPGSDSDSYDTDCSADVDDADLLLAICECTRCPPFIYLFILFI
jgi:hypothetical protein